MRDTKERNMARTNSHRVCTACHLCCCLLWQCEALRVCSGFPIGKQPHREYKKERRKEPRLVNLVNVAVGGWCNSGFRCGRDICSLSAMVPCFMFYSCEQMVLKMKIITE